MRQRILEELEEERRNLERELKELKAKSEEQRVTGRPRNAMCADVADLSNEQKQAIFATPEFSAFIEESTRIVQRALSDGYDYIKDYTVGIDTTL